MTDSEKIVLVKAMTDEADDEVISAFLAMAGESVYNAADPYRASDKDEILTRYGGVQARAAAYYINKIGAEGEVSHSENGISRSYEASDLPPSLLREITPVCGVTT